MFLHHKFIETAKKMGSKTAFIDGTTGQEISYSKALIACLLLKKRFEKIQSKNIGVMIPTSGGAMLVAMACLMAGKTPVMINYSTGAIKNCIFAKEKCDFEIVITVRELLKKLEIEPIEDMLFIKDILAGIGKFEKIKTALFTKMSVGMIKSSVYKADYENDNIVILFTSGSEKDPKAVPLTNKNIKMQIYGSIECYNWTKEERFLATLPLFHIFGFTAMYCIPLFLGSTIITQSNPLEYKTICKSLEKYKPTIMVGTPTFYQAYLKIAGKNTFKSMKYAISGADKLPKKTHQEYREKHDLFIIEGYGATETSPILTNNRIDDYRIGSCGKIFPGVKIKILDISTDEILPRGIEGKVYVKGENITKGYYNDIEETSYHFHGGWYDTGDIGVLDKDDFLWHKGRLKRFVKIGGEMVSLVAIELELEDFFPEDVSYCAVEVPNSQKGAEIVLAVTQEVNKIKIRNFLKQRLSAISIPKKIFVVDDLPLMGSGKVNFREVEKICKKLVRKGNEKKDNSIFDKIKESINTTFSDNVTDL